LEDEPTVIASREDIFYREDDDSYKRDVAEETRWWNENVSCLLDNEPGPSMQRYVNERLTGDPARQWYETISDYGDAEHGCVLGAGPGKVETHLLRRHPRLHLTVHDVAAEALDRFQKRLPEELSDRISTREVDLNFDVLPPDTYDLVIAQSCIHHIVNLEHLAYQVNRSLKEGGRFFMRDVVSESFFQFEEKKKQLFELLTTATAGRRGPPPPVVWPDRSNWTYSPFESVRSGDILDVFGRYLREESVRTCSSLLALLIFNQGRERRSLPRRAFEKARRWARSKDDFARQIAAGQLMFELDAICCDTGYLKPGMAFAVYGKRPADA
jgi:SAM-dependent methyltransferase